MGTSARAILVLYVAGMFATLPLLPGIVSRFSSRFGWGPFSIILHTLIALCILLPLGRLFTAPRPKPPLPHIAAAALVAAALFALGTLASSPVGRVHLVEYALLAILIYRALPPSRKGLRYGLALAAAATVGLLDETVQYFLPNRVFDLYDIALNVAAAALGLLAAAWWAWTARE